MPLAAPEAVPGQAGALTLLVVALLVLASVVLFRSMLRHLRRVPRRFDPPEGGAPRDRSP